MFFLPLLIKINRQTKRANMIQEKEEFSPIPRVPRGGCLFDNNLGTTYNKKSNTVCFNFAVVDFDFEVGRTVIIEQFVLRWFGRLQRFGEAVGDFLRRSRIVFAN